MIVDVDTAVDASVQIVVKVPLVFMSFNTAETVKFDRFAVVVCVPDALALNLKDGANEKLAPTVCHALSFSIDAIRTVSENVYAHVVGTAVNAHHS